MSKLISNIILDLKNNYHVDQYFYPKISMDTDLEGGLDGEVNCIITLLQSNGFDISSENVFHTMELKKKLLERYHNEAGRKTKEEYQKLMLEDIKPIGSVISIEFCLVNGIIIVGLYMLGRFLGSFADESGKIVAQKLLNEDKKNSKELNINIKEYRILAKELNLLIQEKGISNFMEGTLNKKGRKKSQLNRRPKRKKKT